MLGVCLQLMVRCLLVMLFLPFSALDKLLNFPQAVAQAAEAVPRRGLAVALIVAGFGTEVVMSAAVLTGVADRLAACVLAVYCLATAVLWKPFWKTADFALRGTSHGRDLFWDFLKNLSLAGGFLLLGLGTDAVHANAFLEHPFASSRPYATGL